MLGLSYVFYGWVGWSYRLSSALTTSVTYVGAPGSTPRDRTGATHRHWGLGRGAPGDPRLVQVLRLRLGEPRQPDPRPRPRPGRPYAPGRAADRHLLLHLHGASATWSTSTGAARAGQPLDLAVYISFFPHLLAGPIVRGGELLPQIRRRRDPTRSTTRGLLADLRGAVQKGGDLLLRLERDRDARLHVTHAALGAGGNLRRLGVRGADLLRLQRLHRHRHRPRHAARLPVPAELRCALHGAQPAGLLAALAHDTVELAARRPLHTAGRERERSGPDRPQHHDHHGAGRSLARGGVDVRGLGDMQGVGQSVGHVRRKSRERRGLRAWPRGRYGSGSSASSPSSTCASAGSSSTPPACHRPSPSSAASSAAGAMPPL